VLSSTALSKHERRRQGVRGRAPLVLSLQEAADACGLHRRTMYKWADAGKGPPIVRMGRRVGILDVDLATWLERRREVKATS
jgi:excisionase family DNA binding protein